MLLLLYFTALILIQFHQCGIYIEYPFRSFHSSLKRSENRIVMNIVDWLSIIDHAFQGSKI